MSNIFGRFRCKHCGDRFNLSDEEMSDYEDGLFMHDPDCCDDCTPETSGFDYPEFSDADPGL